MAGRLRSTISLGGRIFSAALPCAHSAMKPSLFKHLMKLTGATAVVALLWAASVIARREAAREEQWQALENLVQGVPLAPPPELATEAGVCAGLGAAGEQTGHVRLANGEVWRFAFRSHHLIDGEESYSVFTGPGGSYRVRGDYFCCEVEIPDDAVPKDGAEFVAFLRSEHPLVERMP
jgi:hypothetical protein